MKRGVWFAIGLFAILMLGCSANGDAVLSIFFDGVYPPQTNHKNRIPQNNGVKNNGPVMVVHSPYEEGDCGDCHNVNSAASQKLKQEVPGLCIECHDEEIFTKETVHSPVEDGDCLECHHPHEAKFQSLLKKSVVATCFGCHDAEELHEENPEADDKFPHEKFDDACIRCHNPHSSDQEFLLKEDADDEEEEEEDKDVEEQEEKDDEDEEKEK